MATSFHCELFRAGYVGITKVTSKGFSGGWSLFFASLGGECVVVVSAGVSARVRVLGVDYVLVWVEG